MTILSDTNLETADYSQPQWVHIYNTNVERLNAVLLKIHSLLDVDVSSIEIGDVLKWDAGASKWVAGPYIE